EVGLLDERARADRVDLRGLMVAPERLLGPAQVVTRRVARGVVGDGRGEDDVELGSLCATADLLAPVGVDLAGEIDGEGHGSGLLVVVGTGAAPHRRPRLLP